MPIVPVAIDGPYRIWPRKSWRFRLAKVKITFGEPIDVRTLALDEADDDASYQEVTSELRRRIQQMLYESRESSADRGVHESYATGDSLSEVRGK